MKMIVDLKDLLKMVKNNYLLKVDVIEGRLIRSEGLEKNELSTYLENLIKKIYGIIDLKNLDNGKQEKLSKYINSWIKKNIK